MGGRIHISYKVIREPYIQEERPFLYGKSEQLLCPVFPVTFLLHGWWDGRQREERSPSRPILMCSQVLPVSRRGFASVVQQDNCPPGTSPGWPEEGPSSSSNTSRQAAGICQDGCYLAKQRDPCLLSSTAGNKGRWGSPCQARPLFMSLRMLRLAYETRSLRCSGTPLSKWHVNTGTTQKPAFSLTQHTHTNALRVLGWKDGATLIKFNRMPKWDLCSS